MFGRGKAAKRHPGNQRLRALVASRRQQFVQTKKSNEKRAIAKKIVSQIHALQPPGRFLTNVMDVAGGQGDSWAVAEEKMAEDKIMQRFRDSDKVWKKGQEQLEEENESEQDYSSDDGNEYEGSNQQDITALIAPRQGNDVDEVDLSRRWLSQPGTGEVVNHPSDVAAAFPTPGVSDETSFFGQPFQSENDRVINQQGVHESINGKSVVDERE